MAKHKPEIVYFPYIGEKLNDEPFNLRKGEYSWRHRLKILANMKGMEIHTHDKAKYRNVIGVIFFDNLFYHNLEGLLNLHNKDLLKKTIYIDYEPPTGHAKKHEPGSIKELAKLFKLVVTYDDDLVGTSNFIKGNVANYYSSPPKSIVPFAKRKMVCMITNNTSNDEIIHVLNSWNYTHFYNRKNVRYHPKAAYHQRQKIAEYFLAKYPNELDLYGLKWSDKFSKIHKGSVARDSKIKKLNEYKFAITFDSYINQRGYISEKIFDAFFARTIPIYLGADNISDYIPKECFVDVRRFKSYEELYRYLSTMTEDEYIKKLHAIEKFLSSKVFHNLFSSAGIAKTILDAVQAPFRRDYNREEASDILAQLTEERDKVKKQVGIIDVGKVLIGKKWGFLLFITTGRYNLDTLSGSIYSKSNGKLSLLKTSPAHFCSEEKHDTLSTVLFYEDIVRNKKIELLLKEQGKFKKIPFFTKKIIEDTHYDKNTRFFVSNNAVYIPGIIHKKLRGVYSRYND